jgi:hypothetical protein
MKYNKVFRILAVAVIFSLLMLALPATPTLAASLTLSPTSGAAGTTVTLTGTGFSSAYNGQNVFIFFGINCVTSALVTSGTISASFPVPSTYTTTETVAVTVQNDEGTTLATAYFIVTARSITLSLSSGCVGDTVTVSGSGFDANSGISIYFDATYVGAATALATGTFSGATFIVPESYRGNHTIKAQDASLNYATATFTVLQSITVTPTSGGVGDMLTVNGNAFAGNSGVTIYFDSATVGTATTNASGTFSSVVTFAAPSSSRGSHTIKAQDYSGNYATATFTIAQKITITPTSGVAGTTVTITGNGFSPSRTITIYYNAALVTTTPTTITTDSTGAFTAISFTVPAGLAGTYPVEASDGTYGASANFTATIEVTVSPATTEAEPGYVGDEITVSGTGFKPNSEITITYTSETARFTTQSDANGAFSCTFKVPKSAHGAHTITAIDTIGNSLQVTFIMESEAPAAPKPLLPEDGKKAKAKAHFDWEDVTDDSSPVTYDLQIATDEEFTEDSILVDKPGLDTSEYTLTEEEKLESSEKDTSYYWRVRAVDAASNASDWTTPSAFRVGFILGLPELTGWVLYVLLGVGALFFFFIGLLVGRRRGGGEYDYYR